MKKGRRKKGRMKMGSRKRKRRKTPSVAARHLPRKPGGGGKRVRWQ